MSGDPTLRFEELTRQWVLVAPSRRNTPRDTESDTRVVRGATVCPFCPGREALTGLERGRRDVAGAWVARAVDNLFPMMADVEPVEPVEGAFRARAARGRHEVIIETPDHDADLADLSDAAFVEVVGLYAGRLRELAETDGARAVVLFKNRGPRAGGSLRHAHAQVMSLPVTPSAVRRRDACAARWFGAHGGSLVSWMCARELHAQSRVVEETERFVAFCPWAPLRAHDLWIVPRAPQASPSRCTPEELAELAALLRRCLRRRRVVSNDSDYNVVARIPALRRWGAPWAHWHLELVTRRGGDAGFELSAGMQVSSIAPEETAAMLRAVTP